MKILIVGAGVVGTVDGAHLAAAGHQVQVLRHPPRTDDIARSGLGLGLGLQQHRWDIDAVRPGRLTATVAHRCGCRSIDGPWLRLHAPPEQHLWASVAVG
jgi:glycine/D-amino acid oxidase-like deaminating enzyme